jgi:FdhE protein
VKADVRIVEPGQIEAPLGEIPFLFLPAQDVFARCAERLRHLSGSHQLGEYLVFLSHLADAQQKAWNQLAPLSLPDSDEQARCRAEGMPLLDARTRSRDPAWRSGLNTILEEMSKAALPAAAVETVSGLMHADEAALEEMADRILAGEFGVVSPQELPFIAAALQVYWARMASSMEKDAFARLPQGGLCPVCGSSPSVGIVRSGGAEHGLRYLHCSLCGSEWHMVRIKCSSCGTTEGIDYFTLEGSGGMVKSESCSNCNSYLKLLYVGKDPQLEATADDLATLGLDMLMDREGKARGGPNLLFHPGKPQ